MRQLLLCFLFLLCYNFIYSQNQFYFKNATKNKACIVAALGYLHERADSIFWDGPCSKGYGSGIGTLSYFKEKALLAQYYGPLLKGVPNGSGTLRTTSGLSLSGNFKEGLLNGYGKIVYPDTTKKLEGNFRDGEFFNLNSKYLSLAQKNILNKKDTSQLYVNDMGKDELFYYSMIPKDSIKGVIVLLPGTWETVEMMMSSTKEICQKAIDNNIAVIGIGINQRLALKDDALIFINDALEHAIVTYRLPENKIIIGGFSMGGLFSLRYTQLSREANGLTAVKPIAVFSVDGPTDLERMYVSFEKALQRSANKNEATYALNEFRQYLGGNPKDVQKEYIRHSSFSNSQSDGGNAKYLLDLPVRIYNDLDVNWWLDNRSIDLNDMNALDQSAMINYLKRNGNHKAEFINAYHKGYRPDGTRHPHSWSIVDPDDLIIWIKQAL